MLWTVILLAVVAAAAFGYVAFRRRLAVPVDDEYEWPLPPLVFPTSDRGSAVRAAPRPQERRERAEPRSRPAAWSTPARGSSPIALEEFPADPGDSFREPAAGAHGGTVVDAGPVRFHQPVDGTLQLLPGRMVIVSGAERQEEIRFVRLPGRDPEITFGRSAGTPHMHIQLRARTVSRRHAVMRYRDGSWRIVNMSDTNPVVVNGSELDGGEEELMLADGDRIEMGEVVFVFHER